jgi:DNA-binding transcriptional LysR family regulator
MTLSRTDLAELAVFAAVARHRSFSKAALELGVSASALSHALKGLESRLAVRLLNRSTRAVVPTEAGERLLAQVLPTLGQLEAALAELTRHAGEPVGRLRLCAPEPPSRRCWPRCSSTIWCATRACRWRWRSWS